MNKAEYKEYLKAVYSGWLGKIIGIRLGAPVEGWTYDKIAATYNGKHGYLTDYGIFASDDDSNGPLFFVRALLDKNKISAEDVGKAFLKYICEYQGFFWWGGVGVSTEHTAYENLKQGIMAPVSGSYRTNGKAIAEQIGGQIFSDCWGYVALGDVDLAMDLASKASSVTHDLDGIEGGKFVAGAIALAYKEKDVNKLLAKTLDKLDHNSHYYEVANIIIDFYNKHPEDYHLCHNFILENYGYDKYPGVCHIIPNMALMIMALCYGQGDYTLSMEMLNNCGWDTDCNCGNVGSILGVLNGVDNIDKQWIEPNNDIVNASSCLGYLNIQTISQSSKLFAKLAYKLKGIEVDDDNKFDLPYATNGFIGNVEVKDNSLFVNGDCYKYAYYLGKDIYDARYDPSFSPLVYSNDEIIFELEGNIEARIYVKDCEGNYYYSKKETVNGNRTISFVVPEGENLTVNLYGLEILSANKKYKINDYKINHHSKLSLNFKNYKIDTYGPRYAGDDLYNLRGFVTHSGNWKLTDEGLNISSNEHSLISIGYPQLINKLSVEMNVNESGNGLVYFDMVDYLNFKAIGFIDNDFCYLEKRDNEFVEKRTLLKNGNFNNNDFNVSFNNDRILIEISDKKIAIESKHVEGIIAVGSIGCSNVIFQRLEVE